MDKSEDVQLEEEVVESPQLISVYDDTGDLLASFPLLSMFLLDNGNLSSSSDALSALVGPNATGWELALVTAPSNNTSHVTGSQLAGGFDRLLLDSLYEDDSARRQLELQNAGYGYGGMMTMQNNPFEQHDPFAMSSNVPPPPNVQMAMTQQQQQQMMLQQQQQMMLQHQQQQLYQPQHPQSQTHQMSPLNPFGDPFSSLPHSSVSQQGNHMLL
ncbi:hypothetical protein JCGZ_03218 [Jatropha curcas]|uniref:Uncharacterized protein n=1 Tax=Jatropha curcas TaxID=180498 RepID=A0A067L1H7_JATCU|nr:hypothetical protein JCGZ_03218 [Jatropha curcas]